MDLIALLGIPGLMITIAGWFGKRYLDRKLEEEKAANQSAVKTLEGHLSQQLEIHKQKLRNSEFFFQKQCQASQALYALKQDMLPPYHYPEMEWQDALEEMANRSKEIGKNTRRFLLDYFTFISPDMVEKLESAVTNCDEAAFYKSSKPGPQLIDSAFNRVEECAALLKSEADGQRRVEFPEFSAKARSKREQPE